ncbi:MAG: DUF418 domain-containing protein [Pseudomonadota bacterium]
MQPPAPSSPAPITARIVQLDALRGIAVIGIAWMNVYAFALPLQAYYNPAAFGMESAADRWVWLISFVFIEDKFRTLFAMLFGAGCLILLERGGERSWRAHYARVAVLFLIGLIHATLIASNDILRAYAFAGLALPILARLSAPPLYAIAIGLVAVHMGIGITTFGGAVVDYYEGRLASDLVVMMERNFGSDPGGLNYALGLGQEGFAERAVRRFNGIPTQLRNLFAALAINLSAMTLGMALWRDRMLAGEWRTFRMQRLAGACALIAIPALLVIGWWIASSFFPGALAGPAALIISAPFDMLLALAYALLVMALLDPQGHATRVLAACGRLSLTNYLTTSLIFAALFTPWGLGLFAQVTRAQAFALSFVPIAAMLVWSPLWVASLGQGPLERVWRAGAKALS